MKNTSFDSQEPPKRSIYTATLTDDQLDKLNQWCRKQLWVSYDVDHARFAYKGNKVNVVAYNSKKVVIQGKGTEDFVTFVLEPEITQDIQLGYEEVNNPQWFEHHAGLDESGKGDLFGPLTTACVIAKGSHVQYWLDNGLVESKKISSDKAVLAKEKLIRNTKGVVIKSMCLSMEKYNELYVKFGSNLNKLLAWLHAKSLSNALQVQQPKWGMLDQFSKQPLVQRQIAKDYPDFDLRMETKAERDPVVAAASIIARADYIRAMAKLSKAVDMELKKGASALVKNQAVEIIKKLGPEALPTFAKMHFKTAQEAIDLAQE